MWSSFPSAYFLLPKIQLLQNENEVWITINVIVSQNRSVKDIVEELNKLIKQLELEPVYHLSASSKYETTNTIDFSEWENNIEFIKRAIKNKQIEKAVLSRILNLHSKTPIKPISIINNLNLSYPSCYVFLFEPSKDNRIFGATPEILGRVENNELVTVALAGSYPRGKTDVQDTELAEQLLNDQKERNEHNIVISQILENLQPFTKNINIAESSILKLSNIQHIKTDIHCKLKSGTKILEVIKHLHPTPAVGGQPRGKALEIISKLEGETRGWYAGPIGWMDSENNGSFAVAIRSAVQKGDHVWLYAGCGIVGDSEPRKEWEEAKLKFKPLLNALEDESV
jgi:menaquinone-specific isochorismate synthase